MPMPTAYGSTATNSGSGNWNAATVTGGWNIEITGEDFSEKEWTVSIQPQGNVPLIPVVGSVTIGSKKLLSVRLFDLQGKLQDADISFMLYRP
jgi:hypothetical protein